jgi:acid phosphatase (class A)
MFTRRRILAASGLALTALLGVVSAACADRPVQRAPVDVATLDLTRILPSPAADDSAETRAELDELLRIQTSRSAAQADRAHQDEKISIFRFADALGTPPQFAEKDLPRFTALFKRIETAKTAVVQPAKKFFARKRPYEVEKRLEPSTAYPGSDSYPSGHATWAYAAGIVLADMLPEKRVPILNRAAEFSHNRVVGGVHYQSDVEAGKIAGSVLGAFLLVTPSFRADEQAATAELRAALGLPARVLN